MPFCDDNVHNYKFGIAHLSIVKTVPFLNNIFKPGTISSNLNRIEVGNGKSLNFNANLIV